MGRAKGGVSGSLTVRVVSLGAFDEGCEHMRRVGAVMAVGLLFLTLCACGRSRPELPMESSAVESVAARQDICVRVVDVSNETRELFDVDAIGLLWTGLDEGLRDRGLLWQGNPQIPVLKLYAKIIKYEKGNFLTRPFFSTWGKAHLVAACEVRDGDRVVATAEAKHTISFGTEWLKRETWKKVFKVVGNDLIEQIARKL